MSEDSSVSDKLLASCYDKYENGYLSDLEEEFNSIHQGTPFQGISKIKHDLLQAYLLSTKGDYIGSEQIASFALQQSIEAQLTIHAIDAYLVLMEAYERTQKSDGLADLIQKCKLLLNNIENNNDSNVIHRKIWLLYYNGRLNWWKGKHIAAQQYFEEALEIAKKINNKYDIAVCSRNVALEIDKLDKKKSKDLQLKALEIFREINNPLELTNSLQNLAVFISDERDYKESLKYFLESLEISEKLGNKNRIFWNLNNIGGTYFELDKLDIALDYYHKSYEVAKELKNSHMILISYNFRLQLFIERGDLEKAEILFNEYIELPQIINKKLQLAFMNFYKAHICRMKGQIQEALECMKKSGELLENDENINNYEGLIAGCVWIINFYLELKDEDSANYYLKRIVYFLDKTTDKKMNAIYEQYYKLAEALILKNSLRMKEKVKAQEFFESCIEDKTSTSWQKNLAMINLCDLYLGELSMYGDSRTLTDLNNLVAKMQKVASEKNSYYLMIKTSLIQARLALVEGKMQKAEQILSEALTISKSKGLTILENEIKEEQAQLPEWHNYSNDSLSFNERLQKAQINNYIKEAEKYIGLGKVN